MKTHIFDAFLDHLTAESAGSVLLSLAGKTLPASLEIFSFPPGENQEGHFVRIQTENPVDARRGASLALFERKGQNSIGSGRVLHPSPPQRSPRSKEKQGRDYLPLLAGDDKTAVLYFVMEAGFRGISEDRLMEMLSIPRKPLVLICQELEAEGVLRILSFSPLFLLSQEKFDQLCTKIVDHLSRFHKSHPSKLGLTPKQIKTRFDLHPRILSLALSFLLKQKTLRESGDCVALSDFQLVLKPEEEVLLAKLEELYLKGQFQGESLDSLRKKLGVSAARLDKMITLLIERKKIVQSKDGYILHATWLDDVIQKIRASSGNRISVAEFKEMTGLSRKYAIPLLELLDQLKVTQRRGQDREILR